ncbi:MAG: hypothetical protein OEV00_01060 [Acidobacteriota bacterium]|nr:hypothetical protein [Acidobacteriota bacterium]
MRKYLFAAALILACLVIAAPVHAASYAWAPCNVGKVTVKAKTLSVYCAAPYKGDQAAWNKDVPYYSASLEETSEVRINAMLELLIAARVHDRPARIRYTREGDKNPPGCKASNCRRMEAVTLK